MSGTIERHIEQRDIDQRDGLIDRYLNNQLKEADLTAFELLMIEDEQLFARVQLLDAFKSSLHDEQAALTVRHKAMPLPFRAWLRQPMSLAASVLVLGLGLQMTYQSFATRGAEQSGGGIGAVFLLEATRGSATQASFSGTAPYLFQIDAGPNAANLPVAVTVRDAGGAELLNVDNLQVDPNGWARVVFTENLAGAYTLELVPAADRAAAQTFDIFVND